MDQTPSDTMVQALRPPRWPTFFAVIALACLVWAVFFPILGFEFVDYDVAAVVLNNPHVRSLSGENLKGIFTTRSLTSYYPVRTLTFAVDHWLWGLNPAGFKLTNLLIHLANVLLVFWLVLRLFRHPGSADGSRRAWWRVFAAAASAGLFAIHPVVVEPVTWVAGREELLMTLGALGCIHFHLAARRLGEEGGKAAWALACHASAVLCCALACLSNVVAAVIPLLILAWDLLTPARPAWWKILSSTAVLGMISAAAIAIKELGPGPVFAEEVGAFSVQRVMLVLSVYWLNLKTLVWPTRLALFRSAVIPKSFLEVDVVLGAVALGITPLILWMLRRRRRTLFGLVWFGLALAPSSQILVHHVHRADRFLYLPLVGLAVAVAMGLEPLGNALKRRAAAGVVVMACLALAVCGLLSARQVPTWKTPISMWENCVRVDPDNAFAHLVLADHLAKAGQTERAARHHRIARELDYNDEEAMRSAALRAATGEGKALVDYALAVRLATRACELSDWKKPSCLHALALAHSSLASALVAHGQPDQAIENYRRALEFEPEHRPALFQLAVVLATCRDEKLRNPDEAVRLAERGCELGAYQDPKGLMILAATYAAAGRPETAAATAEKAIGLAQAAGDANLVDQLRGQLKQYQQRSSEQEDP